MFGILFVVLLILVLLNRFAVIKSFLKIEAKVDNIKEDHSNAYKEAEKGTRPNTRN
jgi:Na+-transporting methylmalonyl-CoA/oxaloacetate decarboxylase gamma subunit